jgi:hypothetical protein
MKQVVGRDGEVRTAQAAKAKDARPSNVHWLTPRTWRGWIDIGLRGHTRDGVRHPEAGNDVGPVIAKEAFSRRRPPSMAARPRGTPPPPPT